MFLYIGYPSFKICSLNLIDGTLVYITDDKFTARNANEVIAISAISDTKLNLRIANSRTFDNFIKIINPKNGENISEFKISNKSLSGFPYYAASSTLPDGSIVSTRYGSSKGEIYSDIETFDPDTSKLKMRFNTVGWICGLDVLPNGSLVIFSNIKQLEIFI